jgi:hypothetical protein
MWVSGPEWPGTATPDLLLLFLAFIEFNRGIDPR